MCFLSFHDKKKMEEVANNLNMKFFKGNMVRARPSTMNLSEIIVDTRANPTFKNESTKTFPNAVLETDQSAPAFLNEN